MTHFLPFLTHVYSQVTHSDIFLYHVYQVSSLNFPKFKEINCFDTDEVAGLDSTDIVDEYTTDCVVMVIKEMMEELD